MNKTLTDYGCKKMAATKLVHLIYNQDHLGRENVNVIFTIIVGEYNNPINCSGNVPYFIIIYDLQVAII